MRARLAKLVSRVQLAASGAAGWLADRRIPRRLRAPLFRGFAAAYGADLSEVRPPLEGYPSLGAFFVRRLAEGARPIADDPALLVSPVDGTLQGAGEIAAGTLLQAKGRAYSARELLAGVGEDLELDGGSAWTLYLSPRDYHRIHAPEAGTLTEVRWVGGMRWSVAPAVLSRRLVLPVNERCVLRIETRGATLLLVAVGALNVGRIRVVGVEPGHSGPLAPARPLARGEELARFEMGSTVVLIAPRGSARVSPAAVPGRAVRMGEAIGRWCGREARAGRA